MKGTMVRIIVRSILVYWPYQGEPIPIFTSVAILISQTIFHVDLG